MSLLDLKWHDEQQAREVLRFELGAQQTQGRSILYFFFIPSNCFQCDQIGQILKVLGRKFSHKTSPNRLGDIFWLFTKHQLWVKSTIDTFWKIWATLYSNIWSHWLPHTNFRFFHETKFYYFWNWQSWRWRQKCFFLSALLLLPFLLRADSIKFS